MNSSHKALDHYLKQKGIRYSQQRNKILNIFLESERHLTIAEIYDLVKRRYPDIGYATVYRAMRVICDAGLAEETNFEDKAKRFERKFDHAHHDHLICVKCGRFIEAVNPEIERLQKEMARRHGFTIMRHKMQIFGICRECGKRRKAQ